MKQHITKEQWNELTEKQAETFTEWETNLGYFSKERYIALNKINEDLNNPSIGEMIEFLGDDFKEIRYVSGSWKVFFYIKGELIELLGKNLCDSLWEACKEKLK